MHGRFLIHGEGHVLRASLRSMHRVLVAVASAYHPYRWEVPTVKNQYFGDTYDYIKYGLLRRLTREGEISTALCWMLTPNDQGNDGRRNSYLEDHAKWRDFAPSVFDCLITSVDRQLRDTNVIEASGLLPNTRFYTRLLTDNADERVAYFEDFLKSSLGRNLVCFDPDNGLEVPSTKYGTKESSEYILYARSLRVV